jgi:outer membrane lipoprotein SlyB
MTEKFTKLNSLLDNTPVHILGGGTIGGLIGNIYASEDKLNKYLTEEEIKKRKLINTALGTIYGAGVGTLSGLIFGKSKDV